MAVLVYTGRPGVGKTLTVIDELHRLKKEQDKLGKNFAVFSNIRALKIDKIDVIDFTGYFTSGLFLKQFGRERDFSWLDENQLLQLQQVWMCFVPLGSLILLDEIQNLYPSADKRLANLKFEDVDLTYLFDEKGRVINAMDCLKAGPFKNISIDDLPLGPRHFFEKHRHFGYNVFGTCQNPAQLGKFLRSIAQEIIYITNGEAFGLSNLRQYVHYGSENQRIRSQFRWFSKTKRKLLFSSYQSEFEKGLSISKKFSPKLMIYISFIFLLLTFSLYLFWSKWGLFMRFWNEGGTFLVNDKLGKNSSQTIQVVQTKDKTEATGSTAAESTAAGVKKVTLLSWFIENQYVFEYHGFLLEKKMSRKIYTLDLKACNKEGICFDLRNSMELESFGIVVKPINSCFLKLKDQNIEIFVGCKEREKEEATGKLLLSN